MVWQNTSAQRPWSVSKFDTKNSKHVACWRYTHADRICLKWNVQGAKKASPRHSPVTNYPPLFPQLPSVYFEKLFSGKVLIKYKNAYLHNCNSIKGMDFSQKLMSTTRKIKVIFLKWRKTNKLWRYGRSSQKTVRFMV